MSGSCEKCSGMFAVSNEQRLLGRAGIMSAGISLLRLRLLWYAAAERSSGI